MNIDELVKKHISRNGWSFAHDGEAASAIRDALTEQAETHAIELRAYEATVQNLEQRIRELEAQSVPVVGNPVAWLVGFDVFTDDEIEHLVTDRRPEPLYLAPTTSIPAAELATLRENLAKAEQERDELRKDSERLQYMIDDAAIIMYSLGPNKTMCRLEWPLSGFVQDAFYPSERAAIDAAIAQGKGE